MKIKYINDYKNIKVKKIKKNSQTTNAMQKQKEQVYGYEESIVGFFILRHVRDEITNRYWIKCYHSIRKYYPDNLIVIIDDNSDYAFITNEPVNNVHIIQSEYPGRGELLPYYYFIHYKKLFNIAVILHDSAFINKYIPDIEKITSYKMLWEFEHHWDQIEDETRMIHMFQDDRLTKFYENKAGWSGCFGCMAIIHYDFLKYINNTYSIKKLLDCVKTRYNRSSFERVLACLMQLHFRVEPLLGNIHKYCPWGLRIDQINHYSHLPIIKVWTGR